LTTNAGRVIPAADGRRPGIGCSRSVRREGADVVDHVVEHAAPRLRLRAKHAHGPHVLPVHRELLIVDRVGSARCARLAGTPPGARGGRNRRAFAQRGLKARHLRRRGTRGASSARDLLGPERETPEVERAQVEVLGGLVDIVADRVTSRARRRAAALRARRYTVSPQRPQGLSAPTCTMTRRPAAVPASASATAGWCWGS